MSSRNYHLRQAREAVERSYEHFGEEHHVETGALCAEAHVLLARLVRKKEKTKQNRKLIIKAEELVENAWEHHYDIRDSFIQAIALARIASAS